MTTRPSHAALVEEVAEFIGEKVGADCNSHDIANGIFEFLAARLSDVTPEMVEAWRFSARGNSVADGWPAVMWCAMLAVSPLTPGEKGEG